MNKHVPQSGGLVQAGKNLPAAPGAAATGSPVVDMQDLMPVIQSFQDHMAAEQGRQRSRIRGLVTLFVLALAAAFALPLWAVRGLFREQQTAMAAQRGEQIQTARALEKALLEMADSSRALRAELARSRAVEPAVQEAAAAPAMKPVDEVKPSAAEPAGATPQGEAPAAATSNAPPASVAPVSDPVPPALTSAPPAGVAVEAPAPAPAPAVAVSEPTNTPPAMIAGITNPPAAAPPSPTDLEQLLMQIERSIAEKQRQLKQGKVP